MARFGVSILIPILAAAPWGCSLNRDAMGQPGIPDAGLDTGVAADSGTPDAPDTGPPPPDTGTPDTGLSDTGMPDTGPPDTGPPCTPEACNGMDDDGDGNVDFGFAVCPAAGMRGTVCMVANCTQVVDMPSGHSYLFCNPGTRPDWMAARAACQASGYDLAIIDDQSEHDFLVNEANGVDGNQRWWIGLRIPPAGMDFSWVDGTPIPSGPAACMGIPAFGCADTPPWRGGRPDGSGDCVRLRADNDDWEDQGCASTNRYICEAAP